MRFLVITASKHGSTAEIGEAVAATLRGCGRDAVHHLVEDVTTIPPAVDPADFDVIVLGSAVYTGQWLPAANQWLQDNADLLSRRQVWLFSSGLAGQPAADANSPARTQSVMRSIGALGHRHFPGRLDMSVLSLAERAIIAAARGRQGDHRDFEQVAQWAEQISTQVAAPVA